MSDAVDSALSRSLETRTTTPDEVIDWVTAVAASGQFEVSEHPLDDLRSWGVDPDTGDISHASGRFFAIRGLDTVIETAAATHRWRQPIIVQPDIGVLGLVATIRDGVLGFWVQAKMEPGNRRLVQVSPTVQATSSNFERIHEGSATPFLEYFQSKHDQDGYIATIVEQLQSEQANRYLGKRNLNAIVVIDDAALGVVDDRFRWLTLADLIALSEADDLLHMDTRSILGSFPVGGRSGAVDLADIDAWLADWASQVTVTSSLMPLNQVDGWSMHGHRIERTAPTPFSVLGVRVTASHREVGAWDQPLVENSPGTAGTLLVRRRDGDVHVLLSVQTGLGTRDGLELGPSFVDWPLGEVDVPLVDDTAVRAAAASGVVHLDRLLPEEGGRFHWSSARHVIVEVPASLEAPTPAHRWLTLAEVRALGARSTVLNMELRSLLACLPVTLRSAE